MSPFLNPALSLASALLLVLIFPRFNLTWLAPVALAPLLIACAREPSWKRRFLHGWAAGFVFWCGVCTWIQFVLEVHGGMGKWGGWGTFVLFGLYKGLHLAVFATLAGFLIQRRWAVPVIAALWTGIERTHGTFAFAWLDLGNAGIDMPLPMRLAPLVGVYGLSFVFAMTGCAVALIALRRPRFQLMWLAPLLALLILPGTPAPPAPSQKALAVQPNIDSEMTWTETSLHDTERDLALLSRAPAVSVILWPEVPAPFYPGDREFADYASTVARASNTYFLYGGVAFTPRKEPLNSAIMLDPSGRVIGEYDKMNLVPFGEFVPPPFGFVNRITHEVGDFVPGTRVVVFPVGSRGDNHNIGAFICYESAFPDFVRQFARAGAQVLVNLSNDGYFGNSAAHEQHLDLVRMRAAENRRWIVRATNDGVTASIDPTGRVVARLPLFTRIAAPMPYDYEQSQTPYTRHGDWFAWGCLIVALAAAGIGAIRDSRSKSQTS